MRITKRTAAAETEDINRRAIEASAKLDLPLEMRKAVTALTITWSYEEAAAKAGVTSTLVREWTEHPPFVMALGWVVIGLADYH